MIHCELEKGLNGTPSCQLSKDKSNLMGFANEPREDLEIRFREKEFQKKRITTEGRLVFPRTLTFILCSVVMLDFPLAGVA